MQDKDNKLDELFRNKLREFKLPVSDNVLANIKKGLNVENKNAGFGFGKWMLLITLIVVATVGGYFMVAPFFAHKNTLTKPHENQLATNTSSANHTTDKINHNETAYAGNNSTVSGEDNNKTNITNQPTASSETDKKNPEKKENNSENNGTTVITNSENSQRKDSGNEKENATSRAATSNNDKGISSEDATQRKSNAVNSKKKNAESGVVKNEKKKQTEKTVASGVKAQSDNSTETTENKKADNKANETGKTKTTSTNVNIGTDKKEKQASKKEEVLSASTEPLEDKTNRNTIIADSIKTFTESGIAKQETVKNDSIQKNEIEKATDSLKQLQNIPPPAKGDKKQDKKTSFFAGITGGPSFSYRALTAGNNAGAENRNHYEKSNTTYNAGIEAGITLKNNLLVSIGIRLNNKSEKYEVEASMVRADTTYIPIHDTSGNITGYTPVVNYLGGNLTYGSVHKYQFLTLPVMVGYSFVIKDKLSITPCLGIGIDYLMYASSSWVDKQLNREVVYSKTNGSFTDITFSGKANLDIGYNITKKWTVLVQSGYTRSLQSIYKKDDELKLYPYSYDINLGLRFKF